MELVVRQKSSTAFAGHFGLQPCRACLDTEKYYRCTHLCETHVAGHPTRNLGLSNGTECFKTSPHCNPSGTTRCHTRHPNIMADSSECATRLFLKDTQTATRISRNMTQAYRIRVCSRTIFRNLSQIWENAIHFRGLRARIWNVLLGDAAK